MKDIKYKNECNNNSNKCGGGYEIKYEATWVYLCRVNVCLWCSSDK